MSRSRVPPIVADLGMTALCLGAALAFLSAFSADLRRTSAREGELPVGSVVFTRRTAQRRNPARTLWEGLERRAPVYALDAVRTAEGSEALLKLEGGAEIGLGENSLVVLAFEGSRPSLQFVRGSLVARSAPGNGAGLSIRSQEASFVVKEGALDLRRESGGALALSVDSGSVRLTLESGAESLVGPSETARIEEGRAKTSLSALAPLSPGQGAVIAAFTATSPVEFAWRRGEYEGEVLLELSASGDFRTIAASARGAGESLRLGLGPGTWWWRLRPAAGGEWSRALSFTLLAEEALEPLQPESGKVFSLGPSEAGPLLSWEGAEAAVDYRWELSPSADFLSIVAEGSTKARSILVGPLPAGDYFWRVRPRYAGLVLGETEARPRSFRILAAPPPSAPAPALTAAQPAETAATAVQPPAALAPAQAASAPSLAATPRAAPAREAPASRVALPPAGTPPAATAVPPPAASSAAGSTAPPTPSAPPSATSAPPSAAPQPSAPAPLSPAGQEAAAGPSPATALAPAAPAPGTSSRLPSPRILSPLAGSTIDMSGADSLLFRWEAVPGAVAYRLSLSDPKTGRELWTGEGVTGGEYRFTALELLDVGEFLLRVEALGPSAWGVKGSLPAETRFGLSLAAGSDKPTLVSPSTIYVQP